MEYVLIALVFLVILRISSRSKRLEDRLDQLEATVSRMREQLKGTATTDLPVDAVQQQAAVEQPPTSETYKYTKPKVTANTSSTDHVAVEEAGESLTDRVQQNWMLWLGGLCVALAGIFMAKYSLEQGLLGPSTRIAMGVSTGLALHGAAEWFRRKTGESNPSFAALAGGGSIALFAILLAALHLYQMISPAWAFVLLAMVALATMMLSLIHGPALAAIGLLGAYTVPMFVSDGSGAILFAMGYALVITAAGLLLLRFVYRKWLWLGILLGALAWWAISLSYTQITLEQAWYLAALAYCLIAIPSLNWLLSQSMTLPDDKRSTLIFNFGNHKKADSPEAQEWHLRIGLYIVIAAQCIMLLTQKHLPIAIYAWTPLLIILLIAARQRESFTVLPWVLVLAEVVVLALAQLQSVHGRFEFATLSHLAGIQLVWFAAVSSLVIVFFGWVNLKETKFKGVWSSFITLAPLLFVTLCYFLTTDVLTKWQWIGLAVFLATSYLFMAKLEQGRNQSSQLAVWLIFAGHFAASLAAVILTQEGRLTTAFAMQLVSTAWIIQHFKLPHMGWLFKLLTAVVVIRLTINPWMVDYSNEAHWSLLTFGGSTLCCVIAMRLLRSIPSLAKWAEAAALHLFVLFAWSELRYWLNDGNIFVESVSFLEASLSMVLFGSLAIVYYRRSLVSENLEAIYQLFSYTLMGIGLFYYGLILFATSLQSPWVWENIATTPVFNLLLLSFGAPVLLGGLVWQYHSASIKHIALLFAGAAAFIFINLQIKHLWQGNIRLYEPMESGELYTYSIVWLAIAILLILGAALRSSHLSQYIYRVGIGLLGLVIAKLFLVDMSDLDGLLRVASFMGLGLSLLGLSYLHQRIQNSKTGDDIQVEI